MLRHSNSFPALAWFPGALAAAACRRLFWALALWTLVTTPVRAASPVDLELMLAVDVSASVDGREYAYQVQGLAAAFRDPEIAAAIRRAGPDGIAVSVMHWAGGRAPVTAIDWTHLQSDHSIAAFADALAAMPRRFTGSDTWLGQALRFGTRAILENGYTAPRQLIDLSADGGTEVVGLTKAARDAAVDAGLVINGLAIENEDPALFDFFRDNLIGGAGAFALRASSYDDFAAVMRLKLLREIGDRAIAERVP